MDCCADGDDYGDCACDKDGVWNCLISNSRYLRFRKSPGPDSSTKKQEFVGFGGRVLRLGATKKQELMSFVGRFKRLGATKKQELMSFVGRSLGLGSTKKSEFLLFVGTNPKFYPY